MLLLAHQIAANQLMIMVSLQRPITHIPGAITVLVQATAVIQVMEIKIHLVVAGIVEPLQFHLAIRF